MFEINIIVRNFYINFFIHNIIKKDGFDVHLFDVLIIDSNNSEDSFIAYKLNHQNKNFIIVKTFQLFEVLYILTCFVSNNFFIDVFFVAIDLFADKNFTFF